MEFSVRAARRSDVDSIVPWTTNTFSWGDYVPARLPVWLDDPDSVVLVSVDRTDTPIALCHVAMLSPTEGWLEGARVHPERRRSGVGKTLNDTGVEWARERGARVVRLSTEASNLAARNQVAQLGYREVSDWLYAEFDVEASHRAAERYRMRPAPGSDAEAAWLFWATSDLARSSRELIAHGWRWRTARPQDVTMPGSELVQSAAGWANIERTDDDRLQTNWIASTPEDMLGLIDGLLDLTASRGLNELTIKLPDLPWTAEALTRSGSTPDPIVVHAKPIY